MRIQKKLGGCCTGFGRPIEYDEPKWDDGSKDLPIDLPILKEEPISDERQLTVEEIVKLRTQQEPVIPEPTIPESSPPIVPAKKSGLGVAAGLGAALWLLFG